MSFFSNLIYNRIVDGNLQLSKTEKDVLFDLCKTNVVSLENNIVKLEKNISLITDYKTINNVNFYKVLPYSNCFLYIFSTDKPIFLTKYNYSKHEEYDKKLDEINNNLLNKNKFAILSDLYSIPKNKNKIFTIKKVLATKNKNYLLEHLIDTETLFQTNVPFK